MAYMPVATIIDYKVVMFKARWGLVPFSAKDESFAYKTINARQETLKEKASFKYALEKRRCLIPFTGFYEIDKQKQQHFFANENDEIKSFAGLYEVWGED
jgi:putative SOS response-associated peptidase YedK